MFVIFREQLQRCKLLTYLYGYKVMLLFVFSQGQSYCIKEKFIPSFIK